MDFFNNTPVSAVIFLLTIATSLYAFSNPETYGKFMLHPYSVSRGQRIYSIFTSGLIHKDWGHLFMNMFSFFFIAFALERQIGSLQFSILYLASLALSDLSSILKHKEHFGYHSLGASGAISALVFSYILFFPNSSFYLFLIPIPINAVIFGFLYLIYSAYASKHASEINHDAHFFGALAGIIITIIFNPWVVSHFFTQLTSH